MELVSQALLESENTPGSKEILGTRSTAHILEVLDFYGPLNQHLANPLNKDPKVFYLRPRAIPLSGEEVISGEYLVFDYDGHDMYAGLREFESLDALEEFIIGGAGITNTFTDVLVAFVDSKVRRYEVTYFDMDANKREVFDKSSQYVKPIEDYPQLQLRWLNEVQS